MKNVIQWLKTQEEPDQGIVFLASPEAKYYWLNKEMFTLIDSVLFRQKKVQVGKDQEKAQSEKDSHSKKPRWEKTKLTIRHLYHENIS